MQIVGDALDVQSAIAQLAPVWGLQPLLDISDKQARETADAYYKTLRKLADRKLMRWQDRGCEILDADALQALAGWEGPQRGPRPFI